MSFACLSLSLFVKEIEILFRDSAKVKRRECLSSEFVALNWRATGLGWE